MSYVHVRLVEPMKTPSVGRTSVLETTISNIRVRKNANRNVSNVCNGSTKRLNT